MAYATEHDYQNEYLMGRKPVIRTGFDFYARQASQVINERKLNGVTPVISVVRGWSPRYSAICDKIRKMTEGSSICQNRRCGISRTLPCETC